VAAVARYLGWLDTGLRDCAHPSLSALLVASWFAPLPPSREVRWRIAAASLTRGFKYATLVHGGLLAASAAATIVWFSALAPHIVYVREGVDASAQLSAILAHPSPMHECWRTPFLATTP
jgi:hypothetical protein